MTLGHALFLTANRSARFRCGRGDKDEFVARFRQIADWFGPVSEQALHESAFLVEKLVHRF